MASAPGAKLLMNTGNHPAATSPAVSLKHTHTLTNTRTLNASRTVEETLCSATQTAMVVSSDILVK